MVENSVDVCAGCRNNVENLPEQAQDALALLPAEQYLGVLVGLCDSCPPDLMLNYERRTSMI